MISRVWHGWTATPDDSDAYERLLLTDMLPGIAERGIPGYRGAYLYRRPHGEGGAEFVTTLFFDSLDDVRAFAGEDYETAVIHPDAHALLARHDARAAHYEVLLSPGERVE